MRKILLLAGALLIAGTAHAQAYGAGINSTSGISAYRIQSMRCDAGGGDMRASVVTTGKNDGPFLPTTFASYDEAIENGLIVANTAAPKLGDVARQAREQKKNSVQSAVLIVEQDQYGRMITKAQTP